MSGSLARSLDGLLDHITPFCLLAGLFTLSLAGVGDTRTVSALGLILCAAGLLQSHIQVDPAVLLPLLAYQLISTLSSLHVLGTFAEGHAPYQLIFPALYLLSAGLSREDCLLTRRLCALWTGAAASLGLLQFTLRAFLGQGGRLGLFLGNPNALGIYLVLGWFALGAGLETDETPKKQKPKSKDPARTQGARRDLWALLLPRLEPLLLAALALTLSMGSFVALAAGYLVLLIREWRRSAPREALLCAAGLLAKASLGVGTGLLLYLAAVRARAPWCALLVLLYLLALALSWPLLDRFLRAHAGMAVCLSALGIAVAGAAVFLRPSAAATFMERLAMMRNGLGYLIRTPLGVGPYRWRYLNLADSDPYFNTWHIHNAFLHAGVELGWAAMALLLWITVRFYRKKPSPCRAAGFTAFLVHNLIDTSFFYVGVTALALLVCSAPNQGGRRLSGGVHKALLGLLAALFACDLAYALL